MAFKTKPRPWHVNPARLAPEYRILWRDIVGVWPMWAGGGDLVHDVSGNGLHLTRNFESDPNPETWELGQLGHVLRTPSTHDDNGPKSNTVGKITNFTTSDSLSFLVYFDGWTATPGGDFDMYFFTWWDIGGVDGFGGAIELDSAGVAVFTAGGNTMIEADANATAVNDGLSHIVVCTWDQPAGVIRVYLDGKLDYEVTGYTDTSAVIGASANDNAVSLFGAPPGAAVDRSLQATDYLMGAMWRRELSASEVALLGRDPFGLFRMDLGAALFVESEACVAGTDKRRSSMFPVPGLVMLPCPDGTISDLDRRQIQWMFPIISGVVSKTIITDLDSLIQKQDQLLTTDLGGAIQQQALTETVSLGALIQLANVTITTDLDAKLRAVAILRTTDLDAAIQSPNLLRTVLLDAILKATVQLTVSTDAILKAIGVTQTTDLDAALVLLGQLKTLTMDAAIQLANLTVTTDLDAKLKALALTTVTDLDAAVQATGVTETVVLDALLRALGITRTTELDAALALLNITSVTDLDAVLADLAAVTITTDLDAILKALGVLKSLNLDAAIQLAGATKIANLDAALLSSETIETALDALLLAGGITVTTDLDAVIKGIATRLLVTSLDAHLGFPKVELGIKPSWLGSVGQRMWTKYYAPFRTLDTFPPILGPPPATSTLPIQLDALLSTPPQTLEATLDALIQLVAAEQTALLDAVISTTPATRIVTTALDAALGLIAITLTVNLDGSLIALGQLETAVMDASLTLQPILTTDLDSKLLLEDLTLSANMDASLQSGTSPAAPSNLVATEI